MTWRLLYPASVMVAIPWWWPFCGNHLVSDQSEDQGYTGVYASSQKVRETRWKMSPAKQFAGSPQLVVPPVWQDQSEAPAGYNQSEASSGEYCQSEAPSAGQYQTEALSARHYQSEAPVQHCQTEAPSARHYQNLVPNGAPQQSRT